MVVTHRNLLERIDLSSTSLVRHLATGLVHTRHIDTRRVLHLSSSSYVVLNRYVYFAQRIVRPNGYPLPEIVVRIESTVSIIDDAITSSSIRSVERLARKLCSALLTNPCASVSNFIITARGHRNKSVIAS